MDPKVEGPGLHNPTINQAVLIDLNGEAARICQNLMNIPERDQSEWIRSEAIRVVMSYDSRANLDRNTLLLYLGILIGQGLAGK